jgi:hypothetical protein
MRGLSSSLLISKRAERYVFLIVCTIAIGGYSGVISSNFLLKRIWIQPAPQGQRVFFIGRRFVNAADAFAARAIPDFFDIIAHPDFDCCIHYL